MSSLGRARWQVNSEKVIKYLVSGKSLQLSHHQLHLLPLQRTFALHNSKNLPLKNLKLVKNKASLGELEIARSPN